MKNSFKKLEMQEILNMLVEYAVIENNKEIFLNLEKVDNIEEITHLLNVTDEALLIINRYDRAPLYIFNNYFPLLDIVCKNGVLSALELYETVRLNQTITSNIKQVEGLIKEQISCEYYKDLVSKLYYNESLDERLVKSVDEDGNKDIEVFPLYSSKSFIQKSSVSTKIKGWKHPFLQNIPS